MGHHLSPLPVNSPPPPIPHMAPKQPIYPGVKHQSNKQIIGYKGRPATAACEWFEVLDGLSPLFCHTMLTALVYVIENPCMGRETQSNIYRSKSKRCLPAFTKALTTELAKFSVIYSQCHNSALL